MARSRAVVAMGDRMSLAGLNTVTALLSFCLPERETHAALYTRTEQLLDLLGEADVWPLAYLNWEMALLDAMGFGLDLSCCAATGARVRNGNDPPPSRGRSARRSSLVPVRSCIAVYGRSASPV